MPLFSPDKAHEPVLSPTERVQAVESRLDSHARVLFDILTDVSILRLDSFPVDTVGFFESLSGPITVASIQEGLVAWQAQEKTINNLSVPVPELIPQIEALLPQADNLANYIFVNTLDGVPSGEDAIASAIGAGKDNILSFTPPNWHEFPLVAEKYELATQVPETSNILTSDNLGHKISVPHSPYSMLRNRILAKLIAHDELLALDEYRKDDIATDVSESAQIFSMTLEETAQPSILQAMLAEHICTENELLNLHQALTSHNPSITPEEWIETVRTLPAAQLLLQQAMLESQRDIIDPRPVDSRALIEFKFAGLDENVNLLAQNLLSGSPEYDTQREYLAAVNAEMASRAEVIPTLDDSSAEYQFDKNDMKRLVELGTDPDSPLVQIMIRLRETAKSASVPDTQVINQVWQLTNLLVGSEIQQKYLEIQERRRSRTEELDAKRAPVLAKIAKIDSEQSARRERKERREKEYDMRAVNRSIERQNTVLEIIDENNIRFAARASLTFPELIGNPDAGAIYAQRRSVAENITNIFLLYSLSEKKIGPEQYEYLFSIFQDHFPDQANKYLPRPNPTVRLKYPRADYFNLYLRMVKNLTFDTNTAIGIHSPLGKFHEELNLQLSLQIHELAQNPRAAASINNLRLRISEQSQAPVGELDSMEKLMQIVYQKPGPILGEDFLKKQVLDIFFPKNGKSNPPAAVVRQAPEPEDTSHLTFSGPGLGANPEPLVFSGPGQGTDVTPLVYSQAAVGELERKQLQNASELRTRINKIIDHLKNPNPEPVPKIPMSVE